MGTDTSGHSWDARGGGRGISGDTEHCNKALLPTDVTGMSVYHGTIVIDRVHEQLPYHHRYATFPVSRPEGLLRALSVS
jgi:hypothetical protein